MPSFHFFYLFMGFSLMDGSSETVFNYFWHLYGAIGTPTLPCYNTIIWLQYSHNDFSQPPFY